jgi:hypothetical protein
METEARMSEEIEPEVKQSKSKAPQRDQKKPKDRDLESTKEDPSRESEEREQSPLKTVRGTPIIERTPEG